MSPASSVSNDLATPAPIANATALLVLPWSPQHVGGVTGVVQSIIEHWPRESPFAPQLTVNDWFSPTPTQQVYGFSFRFDIVNVSSVRGLLTSLLRAPLTLFRTAKFLKRARVECVNFHYTDLGPLGIAILKALGLSRGTLVISFHGTDVRPPSGFIEAWLRAFIFRHADHVVACSRGLAARMISVAKVPPGKLRLVYNGVDTEVFRPDAPRPSSGLKDPPHRFIVSVGGFIERKAHADIISAFALLAADHPDLHLCIVGGPGPTRSALLKQAADAGLALRIHFLVGLQREAVAYLLASAELCVQAALVESFPLAVLEAGATGTPLAATNISGHDELIEDRATGRLFRSADPVDCHRVISEMLSDPHATRAVAVALRSLVLDSFTWKHCVCAYGELYANSREF